MNSLTEEMLVMITAARYQELLAASQSPQIGAEEIREALRNAYEQGCIDTHNSIQNEPELALMLVDDAEFGEAADDYAQAILAALSNPEQPGEGQSNG